MMVVTELDIAMLTYWQKRHKFRSQSSFGLQERACFGLTAFVMQCEHNNSRFCVVYQDDPD